MSDSVTNYQGKTSLKSQAPAPYSVPVRISWSSISDQVMSVLNIEKGVFYTVVELLFRPGKAVRKHLFKNRTLLLNPVRFLVLSTTIATFLTFYYMDQTGFTSSFEEGFLSVETDKNQNVRLTQVITPLFLELFKQFVNVSYFFLVPAGAFISWLFVRKSYNVPELSVAHCYMWSMVNCFTILLTPLMEFHTGFMVILAVASLAYPLFFYSRFFNQGFKGFLKGLIINFLNLLLLLFFFVGLAIYYFKDIESMVYPNSCAF